MNADLNLNVGLHFKRSLKTARCLRRTSSFTFPLQETANTLLDLVIAYTVQYRCILYTNQTLQTIQIRRTQVLSALESAMYDDLYEMRLMGVVRGPHVQSLHKKRQDKVRSEKILG